MSKSSREPTEHERELERWVITTGQTALRAVFLINGGAAIALLAFLGDVSSNDTPTGLDLQRVQLAMLCFIGGVALPTVALVVIHYAQFRKLTIPGIKMAKREFWPALSLAVAGVVLFCVGAWLAAAALTPSGP